MADNNNTETRSQSEKVSQPPPPPQPLKITDLVQYYEHGPNRDRGDRSEHHQQSQSTILPKRRLLLKRQIAQEEGEREEDVFSNNRVIINNVEMSSSTVTTTSMKKTFSSSSSSTTTSSGTSVVVEIGAFEQDAAASAINKKKKKKKPSSTTTPTDAPPSPTPTNPTCTTCHTPIHLLDLIKTDRNTSWHKKCFKCGHCGVSLEITTFGLHSSSGTPLCPVHLRERERAERVGKMEEVDSSEAPKQLQEEKENGAASSESESEQPPTDYIPPLSDLRARYQLFEKISSESSTTPQTAAPSIPIKKSPSILAKISAIVANDNNPRRGVKLEDIGGGDPADSPEEEEDLPRSNEEIQRVRKLWAKEAATTPSTQTDEERFREERKGEVLKFRSRLCAGKSTHLRELYESGRFGEEEKQEQEKDENGESIIFREVKTASLKEMFEKGGVRGEERVNKGGFIDGEVENLTGRRREFWENGGGGGGGVKGDENGENGEKEEEAGGVKLLQKSRTASKMLSLFKELEEGGGGVKGGGSRGRGLKEFTPEREPRRLPQRWQKSQDDDEDSDGDRDRDRGDNQEEEEDQENGEINQHDSFLKEVGSLARARSLRAKFEKWEENNYRNNNREDDEIENDENINNKNNEMTSIESARILKEKFERFMREEQEGKGGVKGGSGGRREVRRFVDK